MKKTRFRVPTVTRREKEVDMLIFRQDVDNIIIENDEDRLQIAYVMTQQHLQKCF